MRLELQDLIASRHRLGSVTSPGFIFASVTGTGESSDTGIGPIKPPLSFDAPAETSVATVANLRRPKDPLRTAATFSAASSSFPTVTPVLPLLRHRWHFDQDLRSVTVAGSRNASL